MIKKSSKLVIYLYNHHFIRYIFVGGTTFILDFGILFLLHGKANIDLGIAASVSYWVSIAYNFMLNRNWTFSSRDKEDLRKHVRSYLVLLGFNYLFTITFISIFSHRINYLLAKVFAVAIQMIWTYFIYKNYIFVDKTQVLSDK